MIGQIMELTFLLIMAFIIVTNAAGFSSAAGAVGSLYTNSVSTLQGR